jgi:hypothetical protein
MSVTGGAGRGGSGDKMRATENEIGSVLKAPRPAYLNALIAAPPAKRACGPSSSSIRMS